MIRIAFEHEAVETIEAATADGKTPEDECRRLIAEITSLDVRGTYRRAALGERAFGYTAFEEIREDPASRQDLFDLWWRRLIPGTSKGTIPP